MLALLLAAAPRVAIVVHPTGFADDDAKHLQEKVSLEVQGTGAELWALSKSLEVKTECLVDRACAKDILHAADASYLVWIEALRVGGQVQLESHLLDTEGRTVAQGDSSARTDDVNGAGNIVPANVLAPLKAAVASTTATAAPTTTPTTSATATTTTTTTTAAQAVPDVAPLTPENAASVDAVEPKPLSPLAIGGISAIGGGALLLVGGGALAVSQLNVIHDPASLGVDKQNAANVATAMLVVAGVGVAVGAAGGALLAVGM